MAGEVIFPAVKPWRLDTDAIRMANDKFGLLMCSDANMSVAEQVVEVSGLVTSDERGSAFAGLGKPGLVSRMHEQLDELLVARNQMEQLLRVIVEIGADLDLDAVLRRIILAA